MQKNIAVFMLNKDLIALLGRFRFKAVTGNNHGIKLNARKDLRFHADLVGAIHVLTLQPKININSRHAISVQLKEERIVQKFAVFIDQSILLDGVHFFPRCFCLSDQAVLGNEIL